MVDGGRRQRLWRHGFSFPSVLLVLSLASVLYDTIRLAQLSSWKDLSSEPLVTTAIILPTTPAMESPVKSSPRMIDTDPTPPPRRPPPPTRKDHHQSLLQDKTLVMGQDHGSGSKPLQNLQRIYAFEQLEQQHKEQQQQQQQEQRLHNNNGDKPSNNSSSKWL